MAAWESQSDPCCLRLSRGRAGSAPGRALGAHSSQGTRIAAPPRVRTRAVAAAVIVFVAHALLTASCVRGSPELETSPGDIEGEIAGDSDADIESKGDDDPCGSDPAGNLSRLVLCLALTTSPPEAKEAFCRSQPEPDVRARCFGKTRGSWNQWAGWCRNEFGD